MPIFSFGRVERARIATISLNPSDREFIDGTSRKPLSADAERFANPWLDTKDLTPQTVDEIQRKCDEYFLRVNAKGKSTYYRPWFGPMERLLNSASSGPYSYL